MTGFGVKGMVIFIAGLGWGGLGWVGGWFLVKLRDHHLIRGLLTPPPTMVPKNFSRLYFIGLNIKKISISFSRRHMPGQSSCKTFNPATYKDQY